MSDINYNDIFIVGICMIGTSAVFASINLIPFIGMTTIGIILMGIGLLKRKK